MSDPSRRFRLRALLAAGAVAVTALGAGQAIGTSAASTDAVTATSGSLAAAANVLPASDTAWCDTYKNGTYLAVANYDSQVSIQHVNKAFDYKMFVVQKDGTVALQDMKDASAFNVGDRLYFTPVSGNNVGRHTGWDFTVRIYSVNRVTKEFSSNWIGWKLNQPTVYRTNCSDGQQSGTDAPPNTTANNATAGEAQAMSAKVSGPAEQARSLSAPATTGADKSVPTQSGQSAAQPIAPTGTAEDDSAPATTTAAPTSPATTTTEAPKPVTPETTTTVPEPTTTTEPPVATEPADTAVALGKDLSAKLTSDGGTAQVVISNGGGEVCRADVSPAERILTPEGDGTLSVTGNGGVRNIDTATCSIS
ncbi:hypothetical protein G4X40_10495 [Rhodococcus sp. D2-41]|uniref:hypothetical protein n=1 Tax=Speluncibacter jeojiensis TaxID=2710754 RepID=UPI00240FE7F8|nr:hypothetical protein [Rhodococcus sp. D2-41]MDG3010577.1 hypothetical protein [Rhodococcus sp. D2-41]